MSEPKTVAIIGAGPVGLAAAAHVLERGMKPIVLEAGGEVGHAVRQWGHVQLFSPWEYNIDRAAERLLAADRLEFAGPAAISDRRRTRGALSRAARDANGACATTSARRAASPPSAAPASTSRRAKGRESAPFEIRYQNGRGPEVLRADAVIDASGTWHSPNPAGANGLPAIGERAAASRIAYGMPDVLGRERARYAGKTVAVLGAGHSAIGTLIDLARLADRSRTTRPVWLLRGNDPAKAFGGGANDKLVARGELGARSLRSLPTGKSRSNADFRVSHIALDGASLVVGAGRRRPAGHRR